MRSRKLDAAIENKALLLLTAKTSEKERLVDESTHLAARLLQRIASSVKGAAVMARIDRDPFKLASKAPGYDVTLELCARAERATFVTAFEGISEHLPSAHADRAASAVLVGSDYVFRPSLRQPIRFQYAMRRRADLSHEDYARHYAEVHSEFGYRTRGVDGYAQFHVDVRASEEACAASGFGTSDFDGISQLRMGSLTRFLLAAPLNAAMGAVKDEKRFVDRARSAMFSSRVVAYLDD
jgi:hypothetical protein